MDVMATRVGNAWCGGSVCDRLFIVDWQSVEIRSQRHHGTVRVAHDIADQAGSRWQAGGRQAGSDQFISHESRRAHLVPSQFRMGVDVPTQCDHLLHQAIHSATDPFRLCLRMVGFGSGHPTIYEDDTQRPTVPIEAVAKVAVEQVYVALRPWIQTGHT